MTTLGEVVSVFLNRYRKKSTRRAYENDLNHLMTYIAPGVPVATITGFDVERALGQFLQRDSINSVHTVNKFIKTLHTFFNWCEKMRLREISADLKPAYYPVPDDDVAERTMPDEDFDKLIAYYVPLAAVKPKTYQRPLALFLFIGDTGTRNEGLSLLTWRDIDFKERIATTKEKGDKTHYRPFGTAVAAILQQWQIIQKLADDVRPNDARIFSDNGRAITPDGLKQYFRRRCIEADVHKPGHKGWGPHSIRHRLGFRLADAKVPDHIACKVLGNDINTYRKSYAPKDAERIKAAALEVAFQFADLPKPSVIRPEFKTGSENP